MADPVTAVLLASTVISLTTAALGISRTGADLYRATVAFPIGLRLLQQEISVLRGVVDECYRTVSDGPVEVPPHVKDLLIACFDHGREIDQLAMQAENAAGLFSASTAMRISSKLKTALFILSREKELSTATAIFRDRVGLLRDACSEQVFQGIPPQPLTL